jgi:uncharacterized protein
MKVTLEPAGTAYTLHSYSNGTIVVRPPDAPLQDEGALLHLQGSCLLSAKQLVADWPPQRLDELGAADIAAIAELEPELVLLGSGRRLVFPSAEQVAGLVALGVGYEVMDTAAACRTYNVLVGEGRRVVAALFP